MLKFIVRRIFLLLLTMILVSIAVFLMVESSPGNVARNVLGSFVTPEQEASFLKQTGLDKPIAVRYLYWLLGSDWVASQKAGMPIVRKKTPKGFYEWWAVDKDEKLTRWRLDGDSLIRMSKAASGDLFESDDNQAWASGKENVQFFWESMPGAMP